MKNAFACVAGEEILAQAFVTRRVKDDLAQKCGEAEMEMSKYTRRMLYVFMIGGAFFLIFGLLFALCANFFEAEEGFGAFFESYRVLFFVTVAMLILTVIAGMGAVFYSRSLTGSPAFVAAAQRVEELDKECRRTLNVPDNAQKTDILTYFLKRKNGVLKRKGSKSYKNTEMWIFKEDDKLCFFCGTYVLSVPISSIRQIVCVRKKATLDSWNKETPYNKGEYKKFKVRFVDYAYRVNAYYSLQFSLFNEEFEILIPNYDIQTVFNLWKAAPYKVFST